MKSLSAWIAITGAVYLASTILLAITQAPLGSSVFFICAATAAAAYLTMIWRFWRDNPSPRLVMAGLLLAVAFRAPLVFPLVGPESDMVRYLWDGRVQTLGYNPYSVLPSDPALAATHTDETRQMPSLRSATPYPPAAQLFFRLVVSVHDSTRAMKVALTVCDLLTILVVWRWLGVIGKPEWLVLAYAWNPLVILEIAHSGHLDALGGLWIVASAYWLARRRTALASIAFVLAVTTKLLPVVLVPLYWRRVRTRDALAGAVLFALLYLGYTHHGSLPIGTIPSVVAHVRFNGPLFRLVMRVSSPQVAAVVAVALGLLAAVWSRWQLEAGDPAAWGWPMAIALAGAPVIYPWYLLYFTPFLVCAATLPLIAWTLTVIPTYIVWSLAHHGGRWVVPPLITVAEYLIPIVTAFVLWRRWNAARKADGPLITESATSESQIRPS